MKSKIERQVMAGVGMVYASRQLLSKSALKLYALIASLWSIGALVWVSRVVDNFALAAQGGVENIGAFVLSALAHTTLLVQLAVFVAALALTSLLVDLVRGASARSFA